MGNWPAWRRMVEAAKQEALEAVDHYNRPLSGRGLEGFFVHMHLAWLYLLHAEFRRASVDYRYWKDGKLEKVDGEPKHWDLTRSVYERWNNIQEPVRANVLMTVAIRNKVEHRRTEALSLLVSGKAQALLANFEQELVSQFGQQHSLGNQLRFPVFVGAMSREGAVRLAQEQARAGKAIRKLIASYESQLDASVLNDQRYEVRVNLVQRTGPRSEADMAITWVRADDLTDEEHEHLEQLSQRGAVVVREVERPVHHADWMKPTEAAAAIEDKLPFQFHVHPHFTTTWKKLGVRPSGNAAHPAATKQDLCQYDKPHKDYLYSPAFVRLVVSKVSTEEKWLDFFGKDPVRKVSSIRSENRQAG